MDKEKRKSPVLFIASALLISVWGVYSYFTYIPNTFPVLEEGFYVGVVSGIDEKTNYTFYAERKSSNENILFIVFNDDWMPQTEKVNIVTDKSEDKVAFAPISLEKKGVPYKFTGKKSGEKFTGLIEFPGGRGEWELKPISLKELSRKEKSLSNFDISTKNWLSTRTKEWDVARELVMLNKSTQSNDKKIQRYDKLLQKRDLLAANTELLEKDLRTKLDASIKTEKEAKNIIEEKASELSLLNRITDYGKVVRLARKVSRREHKWYLANWGNDTYLDLPSNIKQQFGSAAQFERELKSAEEKQQLLRQIAYERERITYLNSAFNDEANNRGDKPVWKKVLW